MGRADRGGKKMPTTRRKRTRGKSRFVMTDSVVAAIRRGDRMEARMLLGLKPWEHGLAGPLSLPDDDPEFLDLIEQVERIANNADKPQA